MKVSILLVGFVFALFSACQSSDVKTAAAPAPNPKRQIANSDSLLKRISDDGEKLKLFGYDRLACVDGQGTLILGTLSFWNIEHQVIWYGEDGHSKPKAAKMIQSTKGPADHLIFKVGNRKLQLFTGGQIEDSLADANGQTIMNLFCQYQVSNLE